MLRWQKVWDFCHHSKSFDIVPPQSRSREKKGYPGPKKDIFVLSDLQCAIPERLLV
jgi:hypothetical protein